MASQASMETIEEHQPDSLLYSSAPMASPLADQTAGESQELDPETRSYLGSLPTELVHEIIDYLTLNDICSLRQTCRNLSQQAFDGPFALALRELSVYLIPEGLTGFKHCAKSLPALVEFTKPGALGPTHIRTLKIFGVGYKPPCERSCCILEEHERKRRAYENEGYTEREAAIEKLRSSDSDVALLSQAFTNLAARGTQCAYKITLRLLINDRRPSQNDDMLWCSEFEAQHALQTVLRASRDSSLRIKALDIFANDTYLLRNVHHTISGHWHPSIAHPEKFVYHNTLQAPAILCSLKSLALSYSRLDTPSEASIYSRSSYGGTARLIASCPNLTTLELQQHVVQGWSTVNYTRTPFFRDVLAHAPLRHLQHLSLRHMSARSKDLLCVITRSPLGSLLLDHVALEGSWHDIFQHCTSGSSRLQRLQLSHLDESVSPADYRGHDVQFGWPQYYHEGRVLDRSGLELRKPIRYHYAKGARSPDPPPELPLVWPIDTADVDYRISTDDQSDMDLDRLFAES